MANRVISTAEFINKAKRHGMGELMVSVSYRIDGMSKVRTFDYALMPPMQLGGGRSSPLEGVMGMDPSCWFDDGYRLPVDDWEFLDNCRRFSASDEPKGRALDRARGFFELMERLDQAGLARQLWGSGIQPILQWAEITVRASQDPAFKREADQALG